MDEFLRTALRLDLREASTEVRDFRRDAQALGLHGQRTKVRELGGLALEPVEQLTDDCGQRLAGVVRDGQVGLRSRRSGEQEAGVELLVYVLFVFDKTRPDELGERNPAPAVANHAP